VFEKTARKVVQLVALANDKVTGSILQKQTTGSKVWGQLLSFDPE